MFFENALSLGQWGERMAQEKYKSLGFKIVGQNFFNRKGKRLGEVDFIAVNKEKIVFVEVKTRSLSSSKFGTALEAVDYYKQKKILKTTKLFLQSNSKYSCLMPQIDVCTVEVIDIDKREYYVKIITNAVEDDN